MPMRKLPPTTTCIVTRGIGLSDPMSREAPEQNACWSHARRHLFEMFVALNSPIAAEAVDRIDALYAIEREIRGLDPEVRLKERKERAVPLLDELYRWLNSKLARLPKSSP